MSRYFNTAGPCRPGEHYMLPPQRRLPEVWPLLERGQYFAVHAPRQSGKTTCFRALAEELTDTAKALRSVDKTGEAALEPVRDLMERGRSGQARIPGKHGAVQRPAYTVLPVVVPDEPGALGRLFAAAADAGVNIEDVRIEHTPGLPLGVASLYVLPEAEGSLARALSADGWSVHPGR